MRKIMKTEYTYNVKLDYKPGVSDPGKVFVAYSEIIKSFKRIDSLLGRTLSHGSSCKQTLENVEIGSITSKIKSIFEYSDAELSDEPEYTEDNLQDYLVSSTSIIFSSLSNGKIDSERQIEDIQEQIEESAKKNNIVSSFAYSKPYASEIVDVLKDVSESSATLTENEQISYITKNTNISVPKNIEVDVQKIENDMKKKIVTGKRELILKIKKAYLIGNAQWEFKHGRNSIDAKILDKDWLEKYHKKIEIIAPGDSLEVVVEIVEEYDKYGKLISDTYTIEKVVGIIPGEIDEE